jgi:hypothetical protein
MVDEFKPDQFSGYYDEEVYSKGLTREQTIESHTNRILYFYSKGSWDDFEYAIKIMIPILPTIIKNKIEIPEHNTSNQGVQQHYDLFNEIQNSLENETNMIYKKKFIKTYE